MYAEKINLGIDNYNLAINALNQSKLAADRSDWTNASLKVQDARDYMEQARQNFQDMKAYAQTPDEVNLSEKWNETAYNYEQAFDYVNASIQENAYQATRSTPNYVKVNYYVQQANFYINQAKSTKAEAEQLEKRTFLAQQSP